MLSTKYLPLSSSINTTKAKDMVSQLSLKNDIWGRYGFPSYDDHSVSLETELAALKKIGYVDNSFFSFYHSTIAKGYADLAPSFVCLTYNPTIITSRSLIVSLYTSWDYSSTNSTAGCKIPGIPTILEETWLPYPEEKNEQTWGAFYDQIVQVLARVESRFAESKWFFQDDNFEGFTAHKIFDKTMGYECIREWTFEEKPVDFQRISFGPYGSYWGTLWYFCEKKNLSYSTN
jgi:hypothetical protein